MIIYTSTIIYIICLIAWAVSPTNDFNKPNIKETEDKKLVNVSRNKYFNISSIFRSTTLHFGPFKNSFVIDEAETSVICPSTAQDCKTLSGDCIKCNFTTNCTYGSEIVVECEPKPTVQCNEPRKFIRKTICQFCYQAD